MIWESPSIRVLETGKAVRVQIFALNRHCKVVSRFRARPRLLRHRRRMEHEIDGYPPGDVAAADHLGSWPVCSKARASRLPSSTT